MCLATVYLEDDDGHRKQVMRDVAWIRPENGGLQLIDLLGESRRIQARIKRINLMDSRVFLEEVAADSGSESPR